MKCPNTACGKEITDTSQYCKYCGTKIENPKATINANYQYHEPMTPDDSHISLPTRTLAQNGSKSFGAAIVVVLVLAVIAVIWFASRPTYTCSVCGKTVKTAYYDPYDYNSVFCADCARSYFAPFPYEAYKITNH
nr:zinc-ribbon domain-containing protein [uncultured Butyrivibrio sp.]